jgi:hypothetical protein
MNTSCMKFFSPVILLLSSFGSVALGIAPIGKPTSDLQMGHWSIVFDYSHSEIDLKLKNIEGTSFFTGDKAENVKIDFALAKAGYGIADHWELFAGLGGAKASFQDTESSQVGDLIQTEKVDFDGDIGLAAQIGTRATFYENGPLAAGTLFQISWLTLDGTYKETTWTEISSNSGKGDLDADIFVVQLAPGASYKIKDNLVVYGGPLFQWITGDGNADGKSGSLIGDSGSGDIREDSVFGGWIGLQAGFFEDLINIEFQTTGSSNTFGISIVSEF